MNTYDEAVGPRLQRIRYYCEWITDNTRTIANVVRELPMRPAWQTMAQEEMARTEAELRAALSTVMQAQRRFAELPVMLEFEHAE